MLDRQEYLESVRHRLIHDEDFSPAEGELPLSLQGCCAGFLSKHAWGRVWYVALLPWDNERPAEERPAGDAATGAADGAAAEHAEGLSSLLGGLRRHLEDGYVGGPPRYGIAVLVGNGPLPEVRSDKLSVWRVSLSEGEVLRQSLPAGGPALYSLERFDPVDWDAALGERPAETEAGTAGGRAAKPSQGLRRMYSVRDSERAGTAALSLWSADKPWASNLMLAIIWGLFVVMFFQAGGIFSIMSGFSGRTLVNWGSQYAPLIMSGQWWRLGTAMFLHGGLMHLAFNSYALYVLGPAMEGLYGHARLLFIYLGAGLIASTTSFLMGTSNAVGASGAIFGLMGAYLYYAWYVPGPTRRRLWSGLWPTLAINLVIGLTLPFIDNWAHLGGLVGGLTLAALAGLPGERLLNYRRGVGLLLFGAMLWYALPVLVYLVSRSSHTGL